ncbi:MAG: hypothetical protein IRY95_02095 [Clostridia bacterium]|nr:hypothetical protein [Clostridia bacterium]
MTVGHRWFGWALTALVALATVVVTPGWPALARLVVASPEGALRAGVIVVGQVLERATVGKSQEAAVAVGEVLKGELDQVGSIVRVHAGPYLHLPVDRALDAFPPAGTRVLLLLERDGAGWRLAWSLNAVALVEDGHVTGLYHGARIGRGRDGELEERWEQEDYVRAYDAFYQGHRRAQFPDAAVVAAAEGVLAAGSAGEAAKTTVRPWWQAWWSRVRAWVAGRLLPVFKVRAD